MWRQKGEKRGRIGETERGTGKEKGYKMREEGTEGGGGQ